MCVVFVCVCVKESVLDVRMRRAFGSFILYRVLASVVAMTAATAHSDETQLAELLNQEASLTAPIELTVSHVELISYSCSTGMHMGGGFGCWSTTFKNDRPYKFLNLYASETVTKRDSQDAHPGQCRGSALTLHKEICLRGYRRQCVVLVYACCGHCLVLRRMKSTRVTSHAALLWTS